jgi:hypothetical protein
MLPSGSLVFSATDDMRQVPTMSQHVLRYTLMVGSDIPGPYPQLTSSSLQLSTAFPKAAEGNKLRAENGQLRADAYSDDQSQTFQQRVWSSKEFQIDLHAWVAKMRSIDKKELENLYHHTDQATPAELSVTMSALKNVERLSDDCSIDERDKPDIITMVFLQKLQEDPSDAQIQTFQQRAWSSKEFQIALHERVEEIVTEMKKMHLIGAEDEKTLYHLIHQRDRDIIKALIEIATIDDEETSTEEKAKKEEVKKDKKKKLTNLKDKLKFLKDSLTAGAGVKPFLSARLPFKRTSRNLSRMRTAHILQVPGTGKKEENIFNVQLARYFVENVWKLERPDVIISVTGGASKNFHLRPEYKEKLMRGMMEGTWKLKTWSVQIYVCICFLSV